jgi:two-component system response regulator YesN
MDHRIERAKQFIRENYHRSLTINEIAQHVRLGRSRFEEVFKKEDGRTPMEYLREERINQAKKKLLESDLLVREVASEVGYKNPAHFARDFKAVTGKAPTAFRLAHVSSESDD